MRAEYTRRGANWPVGRRRGASAEADAKVREPDRIRIAAEQQARQAAELAKKLAEQEVAAQQRLAAKRARERQAYLDSQDAAKRAHQAKKAARKRKRHFTPED